MINRIFIVLFGWLLLSIVEYNFPAFLGHGRADFYAGALLAWALFKPFPPQHHNGEGNG